MERTGRERKGTSSYAEYIPSTRYNKMPLLPLVNTLAGMDKESAFIIIELAYNFIQYENPKK